MAHPIGDPQDYEAGIEREAHENSQTGNIPKDGRFKEPPTLHESPAGVVPHQPEGRCGK